MAGLPLKVFAGAYKGEAPNAAVAVVLELDASTLDFVEANGTFNESLEIVSAATDSKGKVFGGERHTANLTLKPDTYAAGQGARLPGFDAGEPRARPLPAAAGGGQQERQGRERASTTSRCRSSTRRSSS